MDFVEAAAQTLIRGVLDQHENLNHFDGLESIDSLRHANEDAIERLNRLFLLHDIHLRRRRNALLPIRRIPNELLIRILDYALHAAQRTDHILLPPESFGPLLYYKCLVRLSEVCSHWTTIILSSPHFWTTIAPELPSSLCQNIIERSGSSGMHIYMTESCLGVGWRADQLPEFVKLVKSCRLRWLSVRAVLPWTGGDDGYWLLEDNERLEDLYVRRKDMSFSLSGHPPLSFSGPTSKLRNLAVIGIPLNWNSTDFTRLERIWLQQLGSPIDLQDIFRTLQQCRNLRTLRLESVALNTPQTMADVPLIVLPYLWSLELFALSTIATAKLLIALQASCSYIDINLENTYSHLSIDEALGYLSCLKPWVLRAIDDKQSEIWHEGHVEISVNESDLYFSNRGGGFGLQDWPTPFVAFRAFADIIKSHPTPPIIILESYGGVRWDHPQFVSTCQSLRVKELKVSGESQGSEGTPTPPGAPPTIEEGYCNLLTYLRRPYQENGFVTWPFAEAERLCAVIGDPTLDEVAAMLQDRYRPTPETLAQYGLQGLPIKRPEVLKLHLTGGCLKTKYAFDICDIVGERNLRLTHVEWTATMDVPREWWTRGDNPFDPTQYLEVEVDYES